MPCSHDSIYTFKFSSSFHQSHFYSCSPHCIASHHNTPKSRPPQSSATPSLLPAPSTPPSTTFFFLHQYLLPTKPSTASTANKTAYPRMLFSTHRHTVPQGAAFLSCLPTSQISLARVCLCIHRLPRMCNPPLAPSIERFVLPPRRALRLSIGPPCPSNLPHRARMLNVSL